MKSRHKTLSYFVTGSCNKCEKCDLLVLCFQHEDVIHRIVNTGADCHFHDIWEFWVLIKMLQREAETACPSARFLSCVVSMYEGALFAVFLSSLINVVFCWLLCSSCARFHHCGLTIPTHRRTLIRENERQTGLSRMKRKMHSHTPLPHLPCRTKMIIEYQDNCN